MSEAAVQATIEQGQRDRALWRRLSVFVTPILLVVVFINLSVVLPHFVTLANLASVVAVSSVLAVMALGQQLVIAVGGIDLSMAATLPACGLVLGVSYDHGVGLPLAMVLSIVAGVLIGLVNGVLIALLSLTDFLVTLGTLSIVGGATYLAGGGLTEAVAPFNAGWPGGIGLVPWFLVVAALLSAGVWVLFFLTRSGTHLLATGSDVNAARSAGVAVKRWRLLAYVGSGALTGVAGVMFVARLGASLPTQQTSLMLSAIAAVVLGGSSLLGGRASVLGTVCGAALLSLLMNASQLLDLSSEYQDVAVGGVVLVAALLARFNR